MCEVKWIRGLTGCAGIRRGSRECVFEVCDYLGKYVRAMKAASGMRPVSINN